MRYGLPRGYLLTMLLSEALAEHILLEFLSKVTLADVETHEWKASNRKSMLASVLTFAVGSGDTTVVEDTVPNSTIYDVFQRYRTGT